MSAGKWTPTLLTPLKALLSVRIDRGDTHTTGAAWPGCADRTLLFLLINPGIRELLRFRIAINDVVRARLSQSP